MFGLIVVTIHGKKEDWGLRRGKKGQGGEVQWFQGEFLKPGERDGGVKGSFRRSLPWG